FGQRRGTPAVLESPIGRHSVNQLSYNTGAFRAPPARDTQTTQQTVFGLIFAFAVEAAIIYILLMTLGVAPKPHGPIIMFGEFIPAVEVDRTNRPPPPSPTFEPPTVNRIVESTVTLEYVPPQDHAITVIRPEPPQRVASLPPPALTFTPARALVATHTTPDY